MSADQDFEVIRDAIAESVGGGFVSHYIVIAEVIASQGEGEIHTISDVDHAWQVLGMLHHALKVAEIQKYHREDDA